MIVASLNPSIKSKAWNLPARAQRSWQHHPSCEDSLAQALLVDPPGDLSDQNWSHALEAQLLMNTQEFDVHHLPLAARHIQTICFETYAVKW